MGFDSIWHWLILLVVVLLIFGMHGQCRQQQGHTDQQQAVQWCLEHGRLQSR